MFNVADEAEGILKKQMVREKWVLAAVYADCAVFGV